jgi:signal peptidase II
MNRSGLFSAAASLALAMDIWTKHLIEANFELYESLPLLPGLALTYVRNPGAAFSMLADADPAWRLPFFMLVLVVALAGCIYMLRQTPVQDRVSRLALGLVVGGALGNGLDRIRYGEVIDFVEVGVRSVYTWPIFNVADSAVFIGVALLIWRAFKPLPSQD